MTEVPMNHDTILAAIADAEDYLLTAATSRSSECEPWPLDLEELSPEDLEEISGTIGPLIASEGTEALTDLPAEQLLCIMDVIQKVYNPLASRV